MAPVILRMDVHCYGCADKIRRVLKNVLGVEEVWVSVERGLVVVSGAALDASLLRRKIHKRTKRPVAIVSAGVEEPPPPHYAQPPAGYPPHLSGMAPHLVPHVPYSYSYAQPYGASTVVGGGWVPAASASPPPQHLLQHVPSEMVVHARHGQYYMPNE
ncbi:hypothetical protein HU200_010929 [Digitaria exilis]|uniref:HMA domain-containing protein n=1 Tax=Digitaria exilis TaxID=1010633 RepID=A0A835FI32_9POAL|nr:hypothetical protein HU200_010929 [Digitaria exilis]CAB3497569.1 unnamed protein product [Digitaria exilis]